MTILPHSVGFKQKSQLQQCQATGQHCPYRSYCLHDLRERGASSSFFPYILFPSNVNILYISYHLILFMVRGTFFFAADIHGCNTLLLPSLFVLKKMVSV